MRDLRVLCKSEMLMAVVQRRQSQLHTLFGKLNPDFEAQM